jgi:prepilin-type N-terminal cleavage/methylation domain-containing protein
MKRRAGTYGFTLIELLVVVAIIALLISILLPSLGNARIQAKNSACLATLRGLDRAYYTYCTDYDGVSISYRSTTLDPAEGNNPCRDVWGELMFPSPYPSTITSVQKYRRSNFNKNRICPLALNLGANGNSYGEKYGSADTSWNYLSDEQANTDPGDVIVGSYGFNLNLASDAPPFYSSVQQVAAGKLNVDVPDLAVFADSVWREFKYNNAPSIVYPLNLNYWQGPTDTTRAIHDGPVVGTGSSASLAGGASNGIERCCVDRHQAKVNVGFRDGSARPVALHDLWNLRWNLESIPVNVRGTPPNKLPAPY